MYTEVGCIVKHQMIIVSPSKGTYSKMHYSEIEIKKEREKSPPPDGIITHILCIMISVLN